MARFYKKFLFFLCIFFLPVSGFATHIVGGSLTYEVGAANSYTITLKLYRDCCPTCFAAPVSATVNIATADGTPFSTATVVLPQISSASVTATLPPCATAPASPPCAEEYTYRATVTLAPPPGGLHLYYQLGNRNNSITNIINPGAAGETFYAYIPAYRSVWVENFTLANGTTSDAGPTAWGLTQGPIPTTTAVVNSGQFEVQGDSAYVWLEDFTLADGTQNDGGATAWTTTITAVSASVTTNQFSVTATGGAGTMTLATSTIAISSYTAGVTLSVNMSEIGTLDAGDSYTVSYSLNGAAPVAFPTNGIQANDFGSQTATATNLSGNTIQIFITTAFDAASPNSESYVIDNIRIMSGASLIWATQSITISSYTAGVNLSVNLSEVGTLEPNDNITVAYSLNGGALVNFPTNGSISNDFGTAFAQASGLVGNTIQVFIIVKYDPDSPASEIYRWDMVSVYDNTFISNSSPIFGSLPPLYLCAVNTFTINYSATDADGDSLAYSMYTPYDQTPSPPSFTNNVFSVNPVTWQAGYSATQPFNSGGPGVTLSGTTGQMTGVANSMGQYVFGVKCSEYRSGVLLSEVVRDYQANVVTCPPFVPSTPTVGMSNSNPVCTAQTLSLTASSPDPGVTYTWSGPNSFTSTLQNPTISNVSTAASGTYSVVATVSGCNSNAGTFSVTVNVTPTAPTASSNTPVCVGNTLSLTATPTGSTYSWNGPGSFTNTAQNPTISNVQTTAAGTYSVIAISAAGCVSTGAITSVTVNPSPGSPAPSGNTPVCSGSTLSLSGNSTGTSYSWSGPNSFTSSLQNPTITSITTAGSGTYSFTVVSGGCGSAAGTTSVTVNATPATPSASSNGPLCTGNTLSLTASTVTGATYSWTGPNSFTSTLQNPTISSVGTVNAGTYSVTASANGCIGTAGTISVSIGSPPGALTVSSNTPVCAGQTLSLSSNSVTSATYSWTGPNSFSSSVEDPTIGSVTTAASGTYSVFATVNGCVGPVSTTSVTINPSPSAPTLGSNSPICSGQTLSLTSSTVTGAIYSWTGPNSFTSSLEDPTISSVTTSGSGTYSLSANVPGCSVVTGSVVVTINQAPAALTPSSNSAVCEGQVLSLTANTVGSVTYSWSGPNSFTSSLEDPTISAVTTAASGNYTVFASAGGCNGPSATTSVVINPGPAAPTLSSNSPVCSGQTLSLTSSTVVGATYSWTGPNGFTSTQQDPTILSVTTAGSGTYSLSANVPGCTVVSGSTSVTINQTPAAPLAGNNGPVCVGATINLTATATGTSYTWNGPNSFTANSQNPTIAGASTAMSGTYSVTATASGCTGPAGTTAVVVNPPPSSVVAASSNSPVCSGTTLSLTSGTIPSGVYSWSGPNSFTANTQNPTLAAVTTAGNGTYSVSITVPGCSAGATGSTSVTVNQSPSAPSASNNSPVCPGQDISLAAGTVIGATYSWTGPNSFVSTLQIPVISPATTATGGNYSVTVTVSGCTGPAGTTSVTITAPPTAPSAGNNGPVCAGNTISLTASNIGGVNYFWAGPNGFSSAIQNPTIASSTTADAGTYSVVVQSIATGCISSVNTTTVVVNPPPSAPTLGSNSPICSGQTLSLTTSTVIGATYSWTGPNSFTSTLQNPSIPSIPTAGGGTYSLVASVAGCPPVATQTIDITVNPTPAAPTVGSNSPACIGGDISLTATSSGATYVWIGPASFSATAQNPIITAVTTAHAGTYSVTTTSAAGCTSVAGTTSVSVNPPPPTNPVVGSNSPVCDGQTISLTCATIPNATYAWSGPNSFNSVIQNPTIASVTSAAAGTYSLIATVPGCGSTGTGTVAVTVNPIPAAPTASSNAPICSGNDLSLNASTVGSSMYSWSGPSGYSSASQNPVIISANTSNSGTYSVTATENGCKGPAGTISVTIYGIPSAPIAGNNGPLCIGDNLSLNAATVAGATYSWNGPNGFTSASQNPTIGSTTTADGGTYSVSVTVNGCAGSAGTTTVIVAPPPTAPSPGSNSPVCSGTTLSLTSNAITGATYVWSGPNSFTSSAQNPTIASVTTAGDGTYSIFATIGSCTSPTSTVAVTILQTPSAPAPGSNAPICSGDDLSLTAGTISGATYSWSGPNGFTSSSQNPTITGATTSDAGTYSVTASVNGCTSTVATITIVVNIPPTAPTAGSNSPACTGKTLSLTANTIPAATYAWSGPNSYSSTLQNPTITPVTFALAGTYSVTLTLPGCPAGPAGMTTVTVNPTPATPFASSNSPICAGSDLSLSSSTVGSSTYQWAGPSGFTASSQNATILAATIANSGTYSVTATENGCASLAGKTTVTVNAIPAVPTATNNGPLCIGDNLTLTSNTFAGATYSWIGPNGFTSSVQNPIIGSVTTSDAGTYSVSVSVSGCQGNMGSTTVVVAPPPSAPIPASNSPVCSGQTLSLSANTITGATYNWNGPNAFTSSLQNPAIANIPTSGSGNYVVFVKIGSCTSPSATVTATVNPAPAAAVVSSNSPLCTGSNLSLTASNVSGVNYTWNGPNNFSSTTQNPVVNNVTTADAGAYSVSLTDIVNGCVTTTSHTVSITSPASVTAGADQSICANNPATLSGTIAGGSGTIIWSTPDGAGLIGNATALNTTYTPSNNDTLIGTVHLVITSTNNGGCLAATDTVNITVAPGPQVNAGPDQSICANNYSSAPVTGTVQVATGGTWSTLGSGTFQLASTILTNTYVPSSADSANGSVILVLISTGNGSCNPVTDTLKITFTPAPLVNAGANILVCFGDTTAQLSGLVTGGASTGTWTTLGTGTFVPSANTLNAVYFMSQADTTAGSVKLVLTSTNNGSCFAVTDTVLVSMSPAPIVVAGADVTVCANNDTVALSGSVSGGASTGYWNSTGTGTFIPDSSALNGSYIPSAADTASGTVMLTLTSTNGCRPVNDSLVVTITPAPVVNAGADFVMCGPSTVNLNGTVSSTATGGTWTSSGNGTFTPNNTTLNASYVPGSNDTSLVYLILTSTGNGQCLPASDTTRMIIGKKPIAAFAMSQACSGQTAFFADASIMTSPNDTAVAWNWAIGAATYSVQTPTHIFATPGTQSVTLIVTTKTGCVDTVTQVMNVNPSPIAAFTYTVDCIVDSVYFSGSATIASGSVTTWSWNFGDGSTSSLQNPVHQYTTAGTYTASLTVTSDSGCTDVFSDTVKACNSIQAGFMSVSVICSGQAVAFTDTSLISGIDSIATWNWTFGDGGTDTVQNPAHTYLNGGNYTVSLAVVTLSGASDTATHVILVNPSPIASYTFLSTCALDSVYFTNTSSIAGGNISSWHWNFGDGDTSNLQNPIHYYDSTGAYLVSLTVISDSGCTKTFSDTLLYAKDGMAAFVHNADCQFNVQFTDSSQTASSDSISAWMWTFGDGATDTVQNPVHNYTASGTYTVQLIVTTPGGCKDTISDIVTLTPLPVADFIPSNAAYYQGEQINFTDFSTNASSWLWDFGDGNTDTVQNPGHTYTQSGTMNVMLAVMNTAGCTDTATTSLMIHPNTVGVPSAFTPNGDGVNDELHVLGGPMKEMDWRIFNEWGNEVFHSTDQKEGWDANYKGKVQPASRYVYILKGTTISGDIIDINGEVTIVR